MKKRIADMEQGTVFEVENCDGVVEWCIRGISRHPVLGESRVLWDCWNLQQHQIRMLNEKDEYKVIGRINVRGEMEEVK